MPDLESNVLLVVNGMMRSGTIWLTRLLADSLNVASRTLYHEPEHEDTKLDGAIWHTERPGKFIRRLHYFTWEYPYSNLLPQVIIVRDPRDTLVSQADYYTKGDVKTRADWLLSKWADFYKAWVKDDRCWALMRYEDLLRNPHDELRRLISTLGFNTSPESITKAVYGHAFWSPATQTTNHQKGKYGKSGAWKGRLSEEMVTRVQAECGEVAEMLGYDGLGA